MAAPEEQVTRSRAKLQCGVYRHFKGKHYLVLGVARHSETNELFVVYVRLYTRTGVPLSVRPLMSFLGTVLDASGNRVKRFRFVGVHQST